MENRETIYEDGNVFVMERMFDVPRKKVFEAFSNANHLANWWGPEGWKTQNRVFDFRPDGIWHYGMYCEDKNQGDFYGQVSWGKAVYHEISAPEKIVYTDAFSDEEGTISEDMPTMLIAMEFIEIDRETKLVTRTKFDSVESLKKTVEMGMIEGTSSQFRRLDALLETI